jgi:hypothetical protein
MVKFVELMIANRDSSDSLGGEASERSQEDSLTYIASSRIFGEPVASTTMSKPYGFSSLIFWNWTSGFSRDSSMYSLTCHQSRILMERRKSYITGAELLSQFHLETLGGGNDDMTTTILAEHLGKANHM